MAGGAVQKAAVFIDGGYMRAVLKQFGEPRIDYEKLSNRVCGDQGRLRTYYYDCLPHLAERPGEEDRERYARMERFLNTLENIPRFEVRLGKQVIRPTGRGEERYEQKQVDVMLALDLVKLSWLGRVDVAVLVAGDDDFVPAVREAREYGVVVRLCYQPGNVGLELLNAADERLAFTESLIEGVRLGRTGASRRETSGG